MILDLGPTDRRTEPWKYTRKSRGNSKCRSTELGVCLSCEGELNNEVGEVEKPEHAETGVQVLSTV